MQTFDAHTSHTPLNQAPALNIDIIVNVISKTIFSPFFCAFVPLTIAGKVKTLDDPAVWWSAVWFAVLCICNVFLYVDKVYSAGGSYFFLPSQLNWGDQIVLITGGSSGVGHLLAETLSMRNVSVVILDINEPRNPIDNDNVYFYKCDVSSSKEIEKCAEKIQEDLGEPTILVNNAGIVKGKLILDLTEEDIQSTFNVNTMAHFYTLKAFLPAMIKKGRGHVVTIASLMGIVNASQASDYCASKAAAISLHQTLRCELDFRYNAPQIRTTLLLPAFIQTPLFSKIQMPHTSSKLGAFLFPPLSPHQIVKAIIQALDDDRSRVIRMPFYAIASRFWGDGVGIMPKWFMDAMQWTTGSNWAMKEYGPRVDAAQKLKEGVEK